MVHDESLTIARTIADARGTVAGWRARGLSVGLVPTMGWLHEGHLALVARARAENDRVLATLFVNPLQFGPNEDFDAYPRDDARDFALLRERRCDAVFAPGVREMFPDRSGALDDAWTRVSVAPLANALCGLNRPGHFDGVATIVLRLLMIALPDAAYFGEKDFQQLTIIKRMVADLDVPVRIAGVAIVREPDGLALSSRNAYLSAAQRTVAPALQRGLIAVRAELSRGSAPEAAVADARRQLLADGFDRVDYLTLASGRTLQELAAVEPGARLFAAAWLGRTRLIDNIPVELTGE
ncbi:MAG: pantoate--beta-alanine ligase [Candidatus Velthaea sp.]|jgi:pantoate--beta-alanine ligase